LFLVICCSAALAVDVADSALPEGVELVEGQLKAQYKKIDYSSLVTYTYVVVPTTAIGELYLRPATVSYKPESDAQELQVQQLTRINQLLTFH
jgi:acetoacetate decarboxylase